MNQLTEISGPDGDSEVTTISPAKSGKEIVSLTVTDKGEVVFMDTNLKRSPNIEDLAVSNEK